MTAEEILKKWELLWDNMELWQRQDAIKAMNEYAKHKCEEAFEAGDNYRNDQFLIAEMGEKYSNDIPDKKYWIKTNFPDQ